MSARPLVLALLLAGLLADPGTAEPIRVAQESAPGAGDFDSNVLGFINPYATGGTLQSYYNYGVSNPVSFGFNAPNNGSNTGLTTDRSHLFAVQGSNGLGLFVVHDRPGSPNGGGSANTAYTIFNSLVGIPVMDDPGDAYASSIAINQPQFVTANQQWVSPNTDGLVLSSLTGDWQVLMSFSAFSGLNSWAAYSPDGSPITLTLQNGRRVQLRQVVPEPGTLAVGAVLFAGAAFRFRRRKLQA